MKLKSPMRQININRTEYVKCPKCNYDCHHLLKYGAPQPGLDPDMLEIECGRCHTKFYEVISGAPL